MIAPVRDMERQTSELLEALERQTVARAAFEVVLADDGSTDAEPILAKATDDGHVRVLPGPRLNAYAARNRAVERSRSEIIASSDADCVPEPDWLENGLRALERADMVAGQIRFILPERLTVWGLLDVDSFLDQEVAVRSGYALGGNVFFRRELFDRVGGFDPSQPNQGDYDFAARCVAAGATLAYADDVVVWHPMRTEAGSYLRKLWAVNRRYAERQAHAGKKPEGLKLRSWVPVVQTARGRLRAGKSLRLHRRRLNENGIRPTFRQDLLALPLVYLVVPYVHCFAQLWGWYAGRRTESEPGMALTAAKP